MDIQMWHGILEGHHTMLSKHLETISLMQQNLQDGSDAAQMLQSCVGQAETALQTFKLAAYRFMAELHSQPLPHSTPSRADTTPIVGGVRGPAPAEQVQQIHSRRRSVVGSKRSTVAEDVLSPTQSSVSPTARPSKRARSAIVRSSETASPRRPEARPSPQPPRETTEANCPGDDDNDDDIDNSYLEAVEAKFREKEEKMWKRMVKKRKRSPDDIDGEYNRQIKTPLPAKLRKKKLPVTTKVDSGDIEGSVSRSQSAKLSTDLSRRDRARVEQNLPREAARKHGVTGSKGTPI